MLPRMSHLQRSVSDDEWIPSENEDEYEECIIVKKKAGKRFAKWCTENATTLEQAVIELKVTFGKWREDLTVGVKTVEVLAKALSPIPDVEDMLILLNPKRRPTNHRKMRYRRAIKTASGLVHGNHQRESGQQSGNLSQNNS